MSHFETQVGRSSSGVMRARMELAILTSPCDHMLMSIKIGEDGARDCCELAPLEPLALLEPVELAAAGAVVALGVEELADDDPSPELAAAAALLAAAAAAAATAAASASFGNPQGS